MAQDAELALVIGRAVKRLRSRRGWSQARLASEVQWRGVQGFTRNTVASTETGRRAPSLSEAFVIALALGCPLSALLDGDENIILSGEGEPRVLQNLADLRAVVSGGSAHRALLRRSFGQSLVNARSAVADARPWFRDVVAPFAWTEMIRKRLDTSHAAIADAEQELWGRSGNTEQESRVVERTPKGASPRSIGVIRGHVTRDMLRELRVHLAQEGS